jgi:penicillin-binding protein 2
MVMDENTITFKSFTRRSFILTIIQIILFSILAIRLFFLQIVRAKSYKVLSEKNRIRVLYIPPARGIIFDQNIIEYY